MQIAIEAVANLERRFSRRMQPAKPLQVMLDLLASCPCGPGMPVITKRRAPRRTGNRSSDLLPDAPAAMWLLRRQRNHGSRGLVIVLSGQPVSARERGRRLIATEDRCSNPANNFPPAEIPAVASSTDQPSSAIFQPSTTQCSSPSCKWRVAEAPRRGHLGSETMTRIPDIHLQRKIQSRSVDRDRRLGRLGECVPWKQLKRDADLFRGAQPPDDHSLVLQFLRSVIGRPRHQIG